MAFIGYFVYGGNEIINCERTEKYIEDASQSWFNPVYKTEGISAMTGETYLDPFADPAPWGDPDNPDSYLFWGAYPLNVTGLEDDTREAAVTQNISDGGWVGPTRKGTKSIVFEVLLAGANECATEAGFRWLKTALAPAPCQDFGCNGTELCYFACDPCLPEGDECSPSDLQQCSDENLRTLRNVSAVSGPTITAKRKTTEGAVLWVATFTVVAGVPYEFGVEVPLVAGFPNAPDPWVPSGDEPPDWDYQASPSDVVDEACADPAYIPIIDPECPAVIVPPGPPTVNLGCFTPPEEWERRWFTIPREYVPYWGDSVPTIRVQAPDHVRNMRLRFYSDVNGDASVIDDPCSYCGDIVFSYIPADHTLVFDGVTQTVYAEGPGGTLRRADSLVFKTDGKPFEWPLLTCGFGYVVTMDFPKDYEGAIPSVDLSLTPRSA